MKNYLEQFWAVHSSHSLAKDWTLEKSVNTLLPEIIREAKEEANEDMIKRYGIKSLIRGIDNVSLK